MILGVIGKAGSGKSTFAQIFTKYNPNTMTIDADRVGHNVLTLSFIKEKLTNAFGNIILNEGGEINRSELGKIVFNDNSMLKLLNSIVHPEIKNETKQILNINSKNYDTILIDAAILYEIGLDEFCDRIILIEANEEIRRNRLVFNRGIPADKVESLIDSQRHLDEKADIIINTDNGIESIERQVIELIEKLSHAG